MLVSPGSDADLHVAFYRTSSIGDVVLATAALTTLDTLPIKVHAYWLGRLPSLSLLASAYPKLTAFEVKKTDSTAAVEKFIPHIAKLDIVIDLQKTYAQG